MYITITAYEMHIKLKCYAKLIIIVINFEGENICSKNGEIEIHMEQIAF